MSRYSANSYTRDRKAGVLSRPEEQLAKSASPCHDLELAGKKRERTGSGLYVQVLPVYESNSASLTEVEFAPYDTYEDTDLRLFFRRH